MSPEQAKGNGRSTLGPICGAWASSITNCLPGVALFQATAISPFCTRSSRISPPLCAVTGPMLPSARQSRSSPSLLRKDPASRYQSASEMVRETSDLLSLEPRRGSAGMRHAKRRSRAIALTRLVALLLTIAAGAWFYHRLFQKAMGARRGDPADRESNCRKKAARCVSRSTKGARSYLPGDPKLKADSRSEYYHVDYILAFGSDCRDSGLRDAGRSVASVSALTPLKGVRFQRATFAGRYRSRESASWWWVCPTQKADGFRAGRCAVLACGNGALCRAGDFVD
jgi:hypothetical protein